MPWKRRRRASPRVYSVSFFRRFDYIGETARQHLVRSRGKAGRASQPTFSARRPWALTTNSSAQRPSDGEVLSELPTMCASLAQ